MHFGEFRKWGTRTGVLILSWILVAADCSAPFCESRSSDSRLFCPILLIQTIIQPYGEVTAGEFSRYIKD
jgi:hypothetical protein